MARRAREYEGRGKGKFRVGDKKLATPKSWSGLRVFGGARVSGTMQEREGYSLDQQLAAMKSLVEDRGGTWVETPKRWLDPARGREVDVPAADVGTAKTDKKRPRYRWAMANRDKWDIYLATAWDRVHRSKEMEGFLETLRHEKKFFVSLREPDFDTTGSTGVMVMSMLIAMARSEALRTQERVQPVKKDMVFRDGILDVGFPVPYGLAWTEPGPSGRRDRGGGAIVADDTPDKHNGRAKADNIRFLFRERARGATQHELAMQLGWCGCNARNPPIDEATAVGTWGSVGGRKTDKSLRVAGALTPRRGRRSFRGRMYRFCPGVTAVRRLLKNGIYRGWLTYCDQKVDLNRPLKSAQRDGSLQEWTFVPLVDGATWERAQGRETSKEVGVRVPAKDLAAVLAWLDAESQRRKVNRSGVVRACIEHNLAAVDVLAHYLRGSDEAMGVLKFSVFPAQVAAMKARAAEHGRKQWSPYVRACVAAEMAKAGAAASSAAGSVPA